MYPPITYELLQSKGACANQLALVKEHFGLEPIPLTDEVIEKFSSMFDINWAAESLLAYNDFFVYSDVHADARDEFVNSVAVRIYKKTLAEEFVTLYKKGMSL